MTDQRTALVQLYRYAQEGEYQRGASHVCTKEFTLTPFLKNPTKTFIEDQTIIKSDFVMDGLPPQYRGKQAYCRIDRNIYRPTR